MANETTTANLGSSNPTLKDSVLEHEVRENAIAVPFINMKDLTNVPGYVWDFQDLTVTPSASAITTGANEADPITNTQLTSTSRTATAASKGIGALLSKMQIRASTIDWELEAAAILGRALADLMDVDALSLAAGFSNTSGSSGVPSSVGDMIAALVGLRASAKGAAENCVFLMHPISVGYVMKDLMSASGAGLSSVFTQRDVANLFGGGMGQGLMSSYAGSFLGKPVFNTTNIPTANAAVDHANCVMVIGRALGGVLKWAPEIESFNKGVDAQLAIQILGSTAYGFVEIKDAYGNTMYGKAT